MRSSRSTYATLNLGRAADGNVTPPAIVLRALPPAEAEALLAGTGAPGPGLRWHSDYPMTETLDAMALVTGAHRAAGWDGRTAPSWWLHQIVLGGLVVGDAGFHGPPADGVGEVEIGYAVVPGVRGRGVGTASCRLLLEQAWRDGAKVVLAETDPDNVASRRVLARAGFVSQGEDRYAVARTGAGDRAP